MCFRLNKRKKKKEYMIRFKLNNRLIKLKVADDLTLLDYLRLNEGITSVKNGCSGQSACGACLVEINGKPKLSCITPVKSLHDAEVITMEGIPENIREILAKAFIDKGAVQCGFCTPGFIMRAKVLFNENPTPSRKEIINALSLNLCRCTGYVKIIDAIEQASKSLKEAKQTDYSEHTGKIGTSLPKYQAFQTAIGQRLFTSDMRFEGMLYAALKFSDHPKAKLISIDCCDAEKLKGVVKVFKATDIPGSKKTGLIYEDWHLMIGEGEITHYIGDVIAAVVATSEKAARKAVKMIKVIYDILPVVTDVFEALKEKTPRVHPDKPNLLDSCIIKRGKDAKKMLKESAYTTRGRYQTQRVEHAFLETEACVAIPLENGILQIYSQGQGIYEDRRQIAKILGIAEDRIAVTLVPNGGGFGGKEDITVQGHTA